MNNEVRVMLRRGSNVDYCIIPKDDIEIDNGKLIIKLNKNNIRINRMNDLVVNKNRNEIFEVSILNDGYIYEDEAIVKCKVKFYKILTNMEDLASIIFKFDIIDNTYKCDQEIISEDEIVQFRIPKEIYRKDLNLPYSSSLVSVDDYIHSILLDPFINLRVYDASSISLYNHKSDSTKFINLQYKSIEKFIAYINMWAYERFLYPSTNDQFLFMRYKDKEYKIKPIVNMINCVSDESIHCSFEIIEVVEENVLIRMPYFENLELRELTKDIHEFQLKKEYITISSRDIGIKRNTSSTDKFYKVIDYWENNYSTLSECDKTRFIIVTLDDKEYYLAPVNPLGRPDLFHIISKPVNEYGIILPKFHDEELDNMYKYPVIWFNNEMSISYGNGWIRMKLSPYNLIPFLEVWIHKLRSANNMHQLIKYVSPVALVTNNNKNDIKYLIPSCSIKSLEDNYAEFTFKCDTNRNKVIAEYNFYDIKSEGNHIL